MGLDGNDKRLLVTLIICSTICTALVAARFWCRYSLLKRFHAADWLILVTLVGCLGGQTVVLWGLITGKGGKNLLELTLELAETTSEATAIALQNYLESLYIAMTIFFFVLYAIKMSICLFYRQIFATPRYRIISLMIMIVATAWYVATEVVAICYCIPIDPLWHPTETGRCPNIGLFYLIAGIVETMIDVAILALPIRAVFTVRLALKTKLMVSGIFLLGGLAIITNMLRIYYSYQPGSLTLAYTGTEIWSNIHITIAILCACLPTYTPLKAKATRLLDALRDTYSSTLYLVFSGTRIRVPEDNTVGLRSNFQTKNTETNSGKESISDVIPKEYDTMKTGEAKPSDVSRYANATSLELARQSEAV
ncbi:hypothetical protein F5Y13DRAFT_184189 [Hypoxylon sp. FL1857]|nr:hypothetical protein F5Y13DRAFT_184189 [Hypoxylon sp. FL1857]